MKNPIRTEAEAFSFVIVCALVFLVVALAGAFLGGWVALAVFAALALGAFIGIYMKSRRRCVSRPCGTGGRAARTARAGSSSSRTRRWPRAPRRDRLARQAGRPRPRRLPGAPDPPLGLRRGSRARGGAEASRRLARRAGAVGLRLAAR